jgi:hypothetical protein
MLLQKYVSSILTRSRSRSHLNDPVKVRVQQLHDDVKLVVAVPHAEPPERDYVVVDTEVPHQPDLPQDMLRVLGMGRHGRYFLDGNLALRRGVDGRGNNAIAPLPNGLQLTVPAVDLKLRSDLLVWGVSNRMI